MTLKLTAKAPKNDGFPIGISGLFQGVYVQVRAVSFKEGNEWRLIPIFGSSYIQP